MTLNVEADLAECMGQESNGHYVEDARKIVIRPGLPLDKEREVVLHEVLHGVMTAANLAWDDDNDEERIVRSISGPLLDTLRRNPQLVKYLTTNTQE